MISSALKSIRFSLREYIKPFKEDPAGYIVISLTYAVLLIPLIVSKDFLFPTLTLKVFVFRLLVDLMVVVWFYGVFIKGNPWQKIMAKSSDVKKLYYSLFFLMFSMLVSSFFGVNFYNSFWSNTSRMDGLLTAMHLFAFLLVVSFTVRKQTTRINLIRFSVIVSLVVSALAVSENGFRTISSLGRIAGPLGNSAYFSGYVLLNIFFALILFVLSRERSQRFIYGLSSVLLTLGLLLSGTRGSFLGLFFGILVSFISFAFLRKDWLLKNWVKILSIIAIIFVLMVAIVAYVYENQGSPILSKTPLSRFVTKINLTEGSRRITLWRLSWDGFKERPIFGWGTENFRAMYYKYYDPRLYEGEGLSEDFYDRAHNVIVQVAIDEGVVGLLAYSVVMFFIIRIILGADEEILSKQVKSLLFGVLSAYFIHNLFVFDTINTTILIALLLGIIMSAYNSLPSSQNNIFGTNAYRTRCVLFSIMTLSVLLGCWYFNLIPAYRNYFARKGVVAIASGDYLRGRGDFNKSLGVSYMENGDIEKTLFQVVQVLLVTGKDKALGREYLLMAENQFEKEGQVSPTGRVRLAHLYELGAQENFKKYSPAVISEYLSVIKDSPKQLFAYYNLSDFYVSHGQYEKGRIILSQVSGFDPSNNVETDWHKLWVAVAEEKSIETGAIIHNILTKTSANTSKAGIENETEVFLRSARLATRLDRVQYFSKIFNKDFAPSLDSKIKLAKNNTAVFNYLLVEVNLKNKGAALALYNQMLSNDPLLAKDSQFFTIKQIIQKLP